MKILVPDLNLLWLGGRGSRGLTIPALKRDSREVAVFSGKVEIKMNSRFLKNSAFAACKQKRMEYWANEKVDLKPQETLNRFRDFFCG